MKVLLFEISYKNNFIGHSCQNQHPLFGPPWQKIIIIIIIKKDIETSFLIFLKNIYIF